ncbi:CPBP family intramembrane glutamic endopeptidase [Myxosarcina sp. GI1]|uniref:CPBP family intramembrane glutamic endopeptidase n=1 Tax=Myxosarcina sp. GI1 TaxID=1541065 RepID=UPI000562D224|nr:type II CAAX endopeptidase family protein [Myxosarcina sp. GI1]
MTIKRIILSLITLLAIARIFFSLNDSLSQPQIQSRLELYQTNLVLNVSELKPEGENSADYLKAVDSLIGEEPYAKAIEQYQKARKEATTSRANYVAQLRQLESSTVSSDRQEAQIVAENEPTNLTPPQKLQIDKQIQEIGKFINEIDLKQGILYTAQDNKTEAISTWQQLIADNNSQDRYVRTAKVLTGLWQEETDIANNSEAIIEANLDSWFRYQSLAKLYQLENRDRDLAILQQQEQQVARDSIVKLGLISGIPVFGSIGGISLAIFLIVQLFFKKEGAILATNNDKTWETPWNWEITWQVLIVGFFFIGQFVLPFVLGISGLNPANYSLRLKALYVFGTYMVMSASGILVLYLSVKSFFPLPQDWFKIKLFSNWVLWGLGGYLVAVPSVLIVSLINQQIWNGQGGSNPLLFLALQAQDKVALTIFFVTASIAAPIFEEIMFRGFLLPSLTRYVSVWGAIIISALIFAVAHLSLSEVLPLATLGIVLGVVYTRSRNLLAPMLLHSLWNSGTLISLFILGSGI